MINQAPNSPLTLQFRTERSIRYRGRACVVILDPSIASFTIEAEARRVGASKRSFLKRREYFLVRFPDEQHEQWVTYEVLSEYFRHHAAI